MSTHATPPGELDWEDIAFLSNRMAYASVPLSAVTDPINAEHGLGPRGAWIILQISAGDVYPLDLAKRFSIGRSLISAELIRLTEARLVVSRAGTQDRRRTELQLTKRGVMVRDRVRRELSARVNSLLATYTREEILTCARVLRDFAS